MRELLHRAYKILRYLLRGKPIVSVTADISYLEPSQKLKGKKIIVTGGGRGLGFAMAKKFKEEGGEVLISGRNEETLREAAKKIGVHYLTLDVREVESFDTFLFRSEEMLGGLNCLVNNAGISLHEGTIREVTPDQYDSQFSTNLRGGYFLSQKFIKLLEERNRRGEILFISSERGSYADDLPYGLTKVALNSLIKGLAHRFVKSGIRVNGVAPGVTTSDMTGFREDGDLYCDYNINDRVYLPGEVAEIASFLLSDVSKCLNGQILECNEGKSINAN